MQRGESRVFLEYLRKIALTLKACRQGYVQQLKRGVQQQALAGFHPDAVEVGVEGAAGLLAEDPAEVGG